MAWLLGILALVQSVLSLRNVRRWAMHAAAPRSANNAGLPPVTVIVPCRGQEHGLRENLAAYANQRYPDYEIILVLGPDDPAEEAARGVPNARVVRAEPRGDEGEKVTKLRAAVQAARASSEVFVFADSDGRPDRDWLLHLVGALVAAGPRVAATTGYRWHLPGGEGKRPAVASVVRAVWNSYIASLLGPDKALFCWGGSTAIRRETFRQIEVERYWRGSISDDYQLSAAVAAASLEIRFVPACLVASHGECTWSELIGWTTRQVFVTRIYAPRLWKLGLAGHGLYCAAVLALLASLPSLASVALLATITAAGMATGWLRAGGAASAMDGHRGEVLRLRAACAALAPAIPFLMLYNFVAAGLTRTIEWRGTVYRLSGPRRTAVLRREPVATGIPACHSGDASQAAVTAAVESPGE